MPSLPNSAYVEPARRLREELALLRQPCHPSARELAGQDEVQITSGELTEMLREAREQAWDEGACAVMVENEIGRSATSNPYRTSANQVSKGAN